MTAHDQREDAVLHRLDDALLVTPEEAARRLSLGRTTVYELIASGRLDSVLIGRSRRVPTSALSRFVESLVELKDAERRRDRHPAPVAGRRLHVAEASTLLALPGTAQS